VSPEPRNTAKAKNTQATVIAPYPAVLSGFRGDPDCQGHADDPA